jgi:hypothetical protein
MLEPEKTRIFTGPSEDTAGEDTADESSKHELANDLDNAAGPDEEPQPEYLRGLQLVTVTASITLVAFLTLLDTSIVATVSVG